MGHKPRSRGVVIKLGRDSDNAGYYVVTTRPEDLFLQGDGTWHGTRIVSACPIIWEDTFPQHKLEPGECKRVRVVIEEVE